MILPIVLTPQSSWGLTLANKLKKEEWDKLRRRVYKRAGYKCEICHETQEALNCHEVWEINDRKRTQTLIRFVCLCQTCHDCVHFGRSVKAYGKDRVERLVLHIMRVNCISRRQFNSYWKTIQRNHFLRGSTKYKVIIGGRQVI